MMRKTILSTALAATAAGLSACGGAADPSGPDALPTTTPIKHLVVIYNENVSFDHYFATYPSATNVSGEPAFTAAAGTPSVNGLSGSLLTANPNDTNVLNGSGAANPFRLDRTQAATSDQGHNYTPEQEAYDNGLMDLFPLYTGTATSGGVGAFGTKGQVMGYYDGNTVTALWNYAQHFAMSDNAYSDTYGPSTPGALEAVSGQTDGAVISVSGTGTGVPGSHLISDADGQGDLALIGDVDPAGDMCSSTTAGQVYMKGKNIGDLLNTAGITWGGFMGGFNLQTANANGTTGCARSTMNTVVGAATADYIPHHNWFQYYPSTANYSHTRPSSVYAIGSSHETDGVTREPANHEYDLNDFYAAVEAGNYPSVSFLKAPAYQDAHAGYSDPINEQAFVTQVVNFLEQQPDWGNTAVVVAYDDSDGWYDHAYATPTSSSYDATADQLNGAGTCGTGTQPLGVAGTPVNGRCGPGTRMPFLVISPWAKTNYVSHTLISQASISRFIEDNWLKGQRIGSGSFDASSGSINDLFNFSGNGSVAPLYLSNSLGTVLSAAPSGSTTPVSY